MIVVHGLFGFVTNVDSIVCELNGLIDGVIVGVVDGRSDGDTVGAFESTLL